MLPMSTTVFRLTPPASFLFSNKLRKVLVALWRFVHHSWCSTNHKQFCGGRRPLFITALTSSATTVYVTSSATTAVLQQLLPLLNPLLRKYNVNTICLLLIVWWFHLYYTRTGHSPPLPIAVHSCLGFCREKSSPFPSLIPSPLPQSSPLQGGPLLRFWCEQVSQHSPACPVDPRRLASNRLRGLFYAGFRHLI